MFLKDCKFIEKHRHFTPAMMPELVDNTPLTPEQEIVFQELMHECEEDRENSYVQ